MISHKTSIEKSQHNKGPPLLGKADTDKFTKKVDKAPHLGKSAEMYQQLTSAEAAILM